MYQKHIFIQLFSLFPSSFGHHLYWRVIHWQWWISALMVGLGISPVSHQPGPSHHISDVVKLSAGPSCVVSTSQLFHPPAPPTFTSSLLSISIILRSEVWRRRKPNADMLPNFLDLTGSALPQDVYVLFFPPPIVDSQQDENHVRDDQKEIFLLHQIQ